MSDNDNPVSLDRPLTTFERCNLQAERAKQAKRAANTDWWRHAELWEDNGPYVSVTEQAAIRNLYRECRGTLWDWYEELLKVTHEALRDDLIRRLERDKLPLPAILAKRNVTLVWLKLNPEDREFTRLEVPLKQTA